jgi:hypothetical protein
VTYGHQGEFRLAGPYRARPRQTHRAYLAVAACVHGDHLRATRKEVRNLILAGQRSLHMKDERDSRKREIVDMISGVGHLGMQVVVYDGRGRTL